VFAELLADRLEGICQLTPQQLNEFQAHYELLMRWNRVLNLTALGNLEDVVDRHYCESIFLALHLPPGPITVADIGSGGGFPGFPVAVLRTDSVVSLIESHRRKAVFLRESSRRLHNIRVIGKRVQEVDEVFEWGISRAVKYAEIQTALKRIARNVELLTGEVSPAELAGFALQPPIRVPWGRNRFLWIGRNVSRGTRNGSVIA
jgi:16S rRNA (guanine(527)-N(7))-methyltransferase RsmG